MINNISKKIILSVTSITIIIMAPNIIVPCDYDEVIPLTFSGIIHGLVGNNMSAKVYNLTNVPAAPDDEERKTVKVTFLEIGSDNCIPCKMMQPVLEKVKKQYRGEVDVLSYDVWSESGKTEVDKFGIRVIPTLIFLDNEKMEYYRHEGFSSFEEIDKILKMKI